ncbi:MAG: glycosyltransferase family 39 protein [Anaerolineae bacterium]|nr:glycosyltransferase family 39 protein [Anaerolineae bacterium]
MSLRYRIPQILLVTLLALVALPQLWYPFGFDQMVYAACGDVIRRGGVPIRDCFETKQMGVMVMYAIPMLISQTAWAVHAFTLLWQAVTSIVIARVARDVFGPRAAWPAAIVYWLMYAGINYWSMDQAETFANLFLLLAFWQVVKSQEPRAKNQEPRIKNQEPRAKNQELSHLHSQSSTLNAQLFFAGVFVGVTFWFKYIFVLVGVAMGAVLILRFAFIRPRLRLASWLLLLGSFALGALFPMLLGLLYYALQTDGLWTLQLQLNFLRENFPLTEPLPPDGMARMILRFFDNGADVSGDFKRTLSNATAAAQVLGGGFPLIIGLGAFGFLRAMIQPRPQSARVAALYLLAYLLTAIVLCIWQGNYIQYHYTLMHVPVALLAAAAFATEDTQPFTIASKSLFFGLYSVFFLAVGLLVYRMTPLMIDTYDNVLVQGKPLRQQYIESKQGAHLPVSEYIRDKTGPDDTIAIFGDAPWIYTLSGRRNATRFSFVNVWIKKRHTPSYALYVQQFADGLAQNKPVYVLLTKADFPWLNNDYIADYKLATPIYNYVETNYAYEGENGPFLLFRRKS